MLGGGGEVIVRRNDAVSVAELSVMSLSHLIVSPGPCTPVQAGSSNAIIAGLSGRLPILGVCLGHQCIGSVFGGRVVRASRCMHGKRSLIYHDGKGIFKGLANPFEAMRYHSLTLDPAELSDDFAISARSAQGELMAIRNERLGIDGVQFHPESFGTEHGAALLGNFLGI